MSRRVIGFVGPAGSGKTTLASRLSEHPRAVHLSIASAIREVASLAYGNIDKDALYSVPESNHTPNPTGREILQDVGAVLRFHNPLFWLLALDRKIKATPEDSIIVIDDLRLDREVHWLREKYATWIVLCVASRSIRVERGLLPAGERDITETDWRFVKPDLSLDTGTEKIEDCLELIRAECLT